MGLWSGESDERELFCTKSSVLGTQVAESGLLVVLSPYTLAVLQLKI